MCFTFDNVFVGVFVYFLRRAVQLTLSSKVNSFSDTTGEVGLCFMKSLKLLDLCRVSCKHTNSCIHLNLPREAHSSETKQRASNICHHAANVVNMAVRWFFMQH